MGHTLLLALMLAGASVATAMGPPANDGAASEPRENTDRERYQTIRVGDGQLRYALILPDDFDEEKTYPAMLALPPGGQDEAMVEAGLGRYWERGAKERGWIVVSPINPGFATLFQAESDPLGVLMDGVIERYHVEGDLFHLTGVSNGGRAAFLAAINAPERFVSLTVLPGLMAEETPVERIESLRDIPVRMFVGGNDSAWVHEAKRTVEALEEHGVDVELTLLEGEGHVVAVTPDTLFDLLEERRP